MDTLVITSSNPQRLLESPLKTIYSESRHPIILVFILVFILITNMKKNRTGVDAAWGKAIQGAVKASQLGAELSPGTKRPPLDKRVRSKWTKKILKKLQAQAISNHDEFKNGEAVNNLGRPPKPLHPGRRQGKSAKSKEVERQLFEKAKSKLSASAPKQPKVIEAKKLDLHVPRGKIAVWVPSGMEPKDITIESKPWVKVNAIVNDPG